jgi:hypothetical protein
MTSEHRLAEDFVPSLRVPHGPELRQDPELESQLAQALESARAAWPGIELRAADFLAYLARKIPERADPRAFLTRLTSIWRAAARVGHPGPRRRCSASSGLAWQRPSRASTAPRASSTR